MGKSESFNTFSASSPEAASITRYPQLRRYSPKVIRTMISLSTTRTVFDGDASWAFGRLEGMIQVRTVQNRLDPLDHVFGQVRFRYERIGDAAGFHGRQMAGDDDDFQVGHG